MTTLRARASVFTAPDFTSTANATDPVGDNTWASWTNATRRGTTTGTFSGFDFSSIPGNATITSVTVEMRHYVSNTGDMNTVVVDGTSVAYTTAPAVVSKDLGTTLPTSIDVVWTRGNNTRSTTCYVDWLEVVVEYTEFPGSTFRAWTGSAWTPGTLKRWNGSIWEPAQVMRWNGSTWVEVP